MKNANKQHAYLLEVRGREAGEAHPLHGREEPPDIALRRRRSALRHAASTAITTR